MIWRQGYMSDAVTLDKVGELTACENRTVIRDQHLRQSHGGKRFYSSSQSWIVRLLKRQCEYPSTWYVRPPKVGTFVP